MLLHILNGHSTEEGLRRSSIEGEFFSFRDALIDGPAPRALDDDAWQSVRVTHLSKTYGVEREKCKQDLRQQTEILESFRNYDEVVLWFEHDLFCQLNLLYLLNWFSDVRRGNSKLSLINIGEFPGRKDFRGLGELNAEELATLFPLRHSVTPNELQLGARAWAAFCSENPTVMEHLLNTDTSAIPFLAKGLKAQLKRFPSTRNGLGIIENKSLELIANGCKRFDELFLAVINAEPVYGLGDAQIWLALLALAKARQPLVVGESENGSSYPAKTVAPKTKFNLTDQGRSVLDGDVDYLELNQVDEWIGGVHLEGKEVWRWDELSGKLKYC